MLQNQQFLLPDIWNLASQLPTNGSESGVTFHLVISKAPLWTQRVARCQQGKMERDKEATSTEVSDRPSPGAVGVQAEQNQRALTPKPHRGCENVCQPWCLLITMILLLLSLLGSWAMAHLTLGTHGGSHFRISASYDQGTIDDTAMIEPNFTTNCTIGKLACSSLELWHLVNSLQIPKNIILVILVRSICIVLPQNIDLSCYSSYSS